jgi:hypothetical protein
MVTPGAMSGRRSKVNHNKGVAILFIGSHRIDNPVSTHLLWVIVENLHAGVQIWTNDHWCNVEVTAGKFIKRI